MMKLSGVSISMILVFMGILCFISKRKHLLATLLSLEFIVLGLYLFLFLYLLKMSSEIYFLMMFLTLAVCEGALGLAILVTMIRTHGNDYFQSFSVLQC